MADRRDQLRVRQDQLNAELHELEAGLRKQTDSVDVSAVTVHQLLSSLQTQRESLSLDLVAKQARPMRWPSRSPKLSKQLEQKVGDDPVTKELTKVVEFHEKELERMQQQQKAGVVTNSDLDKATAELAEARARLLERESTAATSAGGDTSTAWNKELMNLAIDQAEMNARSKAINERLDHLTNAGDLLDRAERSAAQIADPPNNSATANPSSRSCR